MFQFRLWGTKEYPYIVMLNNALPERNMGFEVSLIDIQHNNYMQKAYHIRKIVSVPDEEEWTATIPVEEYPELAKRAVLVVGPLQDFWYQCAKHYHQNNLFCNNTKTAHTALETKIKEAHDTRKYAYWLLVFPKGSELENIIFSADEIDIKREENHMEAPIKVYDEEDELVDGTLLGLDVSWRVALRGRTKIRTPAKKKKTRYGRTDHDLLG